MRLLVTAGPTREIIDPVRYITNRSSGKMGYAIVSAAIDSGFEVTLVSGVVNLAVPEGVHEFVQVETASQMADAVKERFPFMDACIMCAAVADYRPVSPCGEKIKKSEGRMFLELERTEDILAALGLMKKPSQLLAGFAAETNDLEMNALSKLKRKNLDWICANVVGVPDRGFQADTNAVTMYSADGRRIEIPFGAKISVARAVIEELFKR